LREQPTALYALALVALVALLGAQLLFEYRDALAAHAPLTRPLLEAACRAAQCEIAPLRDASALSIEASDLQADPAHKGLLKLTATLRNRAAYAIAYPYLELTLTDPSDAVVARRAFPPAAYAPATASSSSRCSSTRARRRRPATACICSILEHCTEFGRRVESSAPISCERVGPTRHFAG
jgi:hypothetical protein